MDPVVWQLQVCVWPIWFIITLRSIAFISYYINSVTGNLINLLLLHMLSINILQAWDIGFSNKARRLSWVEILDESMLLSGKILLNRKVRISNTCLHSSEYTEVSGKQIYLHKNRLADTRPNRTSLQCKFSWYF